MRSPGRVFYEVLLSMREVVVSLEEGEDGTSSVVEAVQAEMS